MLSHAAYKSYETTSGSGMGCALCAAWIGRRSMGSVMSTARCLCCYCKYSPWCCRDTLVSYTLGDALSPMGALSSIVSPEVATNVTRFEMRFWQSNNSMRPSPIVRLKCPLQQSYCLLTTDWARMLMLVRLRLVLSASSVIISDHHTSHQTSVIIFLSRFTCLRYVVLVSASYSNISKTITGSSIHLALNLMLRFWNTRLRKQPKDIGAAQSVLYLLVKGCSAWVVTCMVRKMVDVF